MNCAKAQKHLASMVFGELDADLKQKISAHLDECEKCRAMHDDMAATVKIMQEAFQNEPAQVFEPAYRDAINEEIRESLQSQSPTGKWRRFMSTLNRPSLTPAKVLWRMAAVFVALLLLAGLLTTPTLKKAFEGSSQLSFEQEQLDNNHAVEDAKRAMPGPPSEPPPVAKPKREAVATTLEHGRLARSAGRETTARNRPQGADSTVGGDTLLAEAATMPAKEAESRAPDAAKNKLAITREDTGEKAGISFDDYEESGKMALSTRAKIVPPAGIRKSDEAQLPAQTESKALADIAGTRSSKRRNEAGQTIVRPDTEPTAADLPAAKESGGKSVFRAPRVNPFVLTESDRYSTFAMDTDTASYMIARRYLAQNQTPPAGAIRVEDFVNVFDYNYPTDTDRIFGIFADGAPSPFRKELKLVKIGVQGRVVGRANRKAAHLIFVVDTSGSMDQADRLPLVKQSLNLLLDQLDDEDWITLISCDTEPHLLLDAVPVKQAPQVRKRINSLQTGGSTNLLGGIKLAYQIARRAFRTGGVNRVMLCSDGAANVGPTKSDELLEQVAEYRQQGITFTSIGFGIGTYNDEILEKLANKGDGTYIFIDSLAQAREVFVEKLAATLQYIAKDAKIQVEFNPLQVRRYRLLGYENRDIEDDEFRNDSVDAGEVGSGQSVTALYEVELRSPTGSKEAENATDLATVYVRYRDLDTGKVEEVSRKLGADIILDRKRDSDPRFFLAACAAEFAEILRGSEYASGTSLTEIVNYLEKISAALPLDDKVRELLAMVRRAKALKPTGGE